MKADYAASRASIAHHSKSFALAARLLPPDGRDRAAAVYAWCRACDDAIDLSPPHAQPGQLAQLQGELDSIYRGEPQRQSAAAAFQAVVRDCSIPIDYPSELLAGMRMDVEQRTYGDREELLRYAFRVAGTVGLMMCHVFRVSDSRALTHAAHLGMAMQLTNICRDVAEDWQRGRLYLPRDVLGADTFDVLRAQLGGALPRGQRAALSGAVRQLLALADVYYASGDRGLAYLDWRAALSVRTAAAVYAAIGGIIAARQHDVLAARAVVPGGAKLRLALRALAHTAAEVPARVRARVRRTLPASRLALEEALRATPGSQTAAAEGQ